jgi:peroxiredoxin Q/BCP
MTYRDRMSPLIVEGGTQMDALLVGQAAPDFAMAASDGTTVRLSDFLGKRQVVLAFYPRDFSGG